MLAVGQIRRRASDLVATLVPMSDDYVWEKLFVAVEHLASKDFDDLDQRLQVPGDHACVRFRSASGAKCRRHHR